MATVIYGYNQYGTGSSAPPSLADGDSVFVMSNVIIGSTTSTGLYAGGSNHVGSIYGAIVGNYVGLYWGGDAATDHNNHLHVKAGGSISGYQYDGVFLLGYGSSIDNDGDIFGTSAGVEIRGDTNAVGMLIDNSGTIKSEATGILRSGAVGLTVTNSGLIKGTNYSFAVLSEDGIDKITNSGTMIGKIDLGGGNDTYDGRKGHVQGTVYGGAGNDQLYGGTENNTLFGGIGNDTLTGGTGNDRFTFTEALKTAGIDKITDFSNKSQDDRIYMDDAVFKALGSSVTSSEFYAVTKGHAAHDSSDNLIYNKTDGTLWYDADGTGKSAAVQIATLTNKAALDYHDFFVA